jgi:hypothetical protein
VYVGTALTFGAGRLVVGHERELALEGRELGGVAGRRAWKRRNLRATLVRSTAQRCHCSIGHVEAGFGEQLLGEPPLLGRAGVAAAVVAAAVGAPGEEDAGRAEPDGLDDVQGADAADARQLDEPHALRVPVAVLAAQVRAAPAHSLQ